MLEKDAWEGVMSGDSVSEPLQSDEPASILLEHIRAEKERLIQEGKIKRDKHQSVIYRRDNSHYEKSDGIERCIDDEIPFEIPDSWAWTSVGEVCSNIQYGSSQKSSLTGKIAVLRMGNLQNGRIVLDKLVGKVAIYKGEILCQISLQNII